MKRFMKGLRKGEKGFTLIELLIVVAILGILAAVIVPNLSSFLGTGTVAAANTEAANCETAALAYYADNDGVWPGTSAALTSYLSNTPKATYTFSTTSGKITAATPATTGGWTGITWTGGEGGQWKKTAS